MDERRKHKRLDLDVSVQLERLDQDDITTLKFIHVVVTDISRSGIGFVSDQNLKVGTYYDTKIQIWTKEVIDAVLEIVRCDPKGLRGFAFHHAAQSSSETLSAYHYPSALSRT